MVAPMITFGKLENYWAIAEVVRLPPKIENHRITGSTDQPELTIFRKLKQRQNA
ncbi:22454_t:CDS:1, partial [Racocetra persica]